MRPMLRVQYQPTEQGSVFLLAIVILTVILLLGASLIEKAQTSVYRATIDNRTTKSFHLAEAGIDKAVWSLNQPNGWLTYAGESNTALSGGFVDVTVTPGPSARGIFTEHLTLISTGRLPGAANQHTRRTIRAIAHKDPRCFAFAIFGSEKVDIGNGTVTVLADSYTSDNGTYEPGKERAKATVGTNSTDGNAVEILQEGEVHGDIQVGPGAPFPNLCVTNMGTITGTISALPAPNLLPSIASIPAGHTNLGDVWLEADQQLVLNAGTYHITDLDMFGNARIICNGKVVIFLDESSDEGTPDIRIGGNGIVNTSGLPSNLVIYCMNDVVSIAIIANGAFYGSIYAPKADIVLDSGQLYGSVVGKTVTVNGATSSLHYDEALRDHSDPRAYITSWEML